MERLQEADGLALQHKPGGIEVLDVLRVVEGPRGSAEEIAIEQLRGASVRVQLRQRRVARPREQGSTITTVPAESDSGGNEARRREDRHERVVRDHGVLVRAFLRVHERRRTEQRLQHQVEAGAEDDLRVGDRGNDFRSPWLKDDRNSSNGSSSGSHSSCLYGFGVKLRWLTRHLTVAGLLPSVLRVS